MLGKFKLQRESRCIRRRRICGSLSKKGGQGDSDRSLLWLIFFGKNRKSGGSE